MNVLADQQARDRFTQALNSNVCISASAGAGKTRAIVDRVEALIRQPLANSSSDPLECLVVVTYGEMAAQELKVRCRERLISAADAPHRKNALMARFSRVYFGTIHSFCLRLLREYGNHLGLPGQVRLLSSQDALFFERFKQSLDLESLAWPPIRAQTALKYYSLEEVFNIVESLKPDQVEHYCRIPDSDLPLPDVTPLLEYPVTQRSLNTVGRIQNNLRRWLADVDQERPFLYLPKVDAGGKDFKADGHTLLEPYREWLAESVVIMAAHISQAYRHHRINNVRLTYDDMISETLRLTKNPQVLDQMRRRGWMVILDEAQDTDAEMFQILTEITRPQGAPYGSWPREADAAGPVAGHFSFVGDDQQCIYSSRADIGKYLDYVQAYARGHGGERLEFSVTMRCPQPVVAAVNRVFPGRILQSRAEFRKMMAAPFHDAAGTAAIRLPIQLEQGEKASDQLLFEQECREVAHWLAQEGLNGLGVKEWSEVAVLCPRVSWLAAAGEAFEAAGIPVAHKSSRRIAADQPLYTWPYALLHVVAAPYDRFELIGVLRDVFVIPDPELERLHLADPEGLSLFSARFATGQLAEALNILECGHQELMGRQRESPSLPLARAVRQFVASCRLVERLDVLGEDLDGLSRFFHSIEEASASGWTLMDWLEAERQKLEEVTPPVATMGGLDLISCHKSKGLEWPVVILVGMWRKIHHMSPSYPSVHQQGNQMRVMASGDSAGEDWKHLMERSRNEELQRLLYVAMTRSQKTLIISDPDAESKRVHFRDLIGWNEIYDVFATELPVCQTSPLNKNALTISSAVPEAQARAFKNWSCEIPERLLPHALAEDKGNSMHQLDTQPVREEPVVGGVEYGTVWHEWVEHLPWRKGLNECLQYREMSLQMRIESGMPAPVYQRLKSEVEILFQSEWMLSLLDDGKHFLPELPFLWPISKNQWMEGVIDLVVRFDERDWAVVDWKTNHRMQHESQEQFESRMQTSYHAQLEAYARVCAQQNPQSDVRFGLYLTEAGKYLELGRTDSESG
ncbi:MAG: UvrD-helicase domain-containing protein [Verrucomicrobiota bacterium]